jgi:hypothetical protein
MAPVLALGLCAGRSAGAAPPAPSTQPGDGAAGIAGPGKAGFSLTIYSLADPAQFDPQQLAAQRAANPYYAWQYKLPGYGVVREIRGIDLVAGDNTVRFSDVASGIDPTTVSFQSLTAPASTFVQEQNYEYDLVNSDKLLMKYLDKKITLQRKRSAGLDPTLQLVETASGTLLSFDAANIVLQAEDKGVQIIPRGAEISAIKLTALETGLITKPTLVWKITTDKAGPHQAQVTYQTDNLTWRADYTVIINKDDTAADLSAWVSILNESGASYPMAKLKLVAGDVQRIKPPQQQANMGYRQMEPKGGAERGFEEKSFFEYHLYTLGHPTSLPNNSTKQVELFSPKLNVPVVKTFVYYGASNDWRYYTPSSPNADQNLGTQSNKKVDVYVSIRNSKENNLGIPMPAGRIRAYKTDEADGNNEFIGEDIIQHTPKDEEILVKLGSAFDIVGERKQTEFKADYNAHWITESFEIKLRNHKKEPVKVIVKENLFRWVNWEVTASSDKYEKQDFRTIHIPVEIPVDGEKKVTYSVKYTW